MRQLDRDILALAVPSVIANITTPLLGLVDTAITGHLGSESYIAAIAVGASMFNLLYWLFAFLRMGTSGLTAIATGQRDTRQQALILYRGLLVAASVSILMIALSRPIADGLLIFLDPDPATATLARRYFNTVVWGAPAVLATYVLTGWFLGMQSSRRPMIISITINVINIAISPLLAFGAGMKLDGVAAGTLSAQCAGVIIGMLMCMRYRLPKVALREIIDTSQLKRYFAVNRDIMLRTACLIAVTLWFTREGARQGETILAVNALLMQLFILFSYMIDGFAFAGEA
ncbi:MAG: MATE family efflux transporter, partial [Muribaculaceae bacterium]|nr:MATE family efflux transporter [Muribaculaceae bacterium]